jgi:hypothetical protein
MPLTTTEVPTFFGPPDSPLFGVLHLPADGQIRAGVLICGSLGKEGMDSIRLHRILGEGLARRGFGVLHFDYLGTGDSAYAQGRDDALANWLASVGHALDYLRLIGAQSVTAIGVRAGCLILDAHLAASPQQHPVNRVVYLDPPGTGRRYLREHTTLFRLSAGEDAATPGEVSIVGGRLSDQAAAEFAALQIAADPVGAHGLDNVLVVGRPAETDKRLNALASADGVDSITTRGLQECARPSEVLLPVPFAAVDSIIEWADRNVPTGTHRVVPQYLTTVTMPAEGPDGVDVVESIERIGPSGLFAIRTVPLHRRRTPARTVLFFVTAHDLHVGPTRQWVELSRRIAATGAQGLRWDPSEQGLSGPVSLDPWRRIFTKADITDSVAAARHACQDAGELELVGVCSGSWYVAHTARIIGARSATMVNLVAWNWRVSSTLLQQWSFHKKALQANAAVDADGDAGESRTGGAGESRATRLIAGLNRAREPMRSLIHQHLPRPVLWVLGWLGLVWLPEQLLTPLARRGTAVTVITSPEDAEQFAAKGGRAALGRLQWTPRPPRLIAPPTGDHAANHPAILAAIRDAVSPLTVPASEHPLIGHHVVA